MEPDLCFLQERLQRRLLKIVVKDKDVVLDDFIGRIQFDLSEVPRRAPPDSPLAPQWYRLEDKKGEKIKKGEIMLAIGKELRRMRHFLKPGILMQHLNHAQKTRILKSVSAMWNEDLLFVTAEPFEDPLVISVEDRIGANKDEILGKCVLPLHTIPRRFDNKAVPARWHNLEKHTIIEGEKKEIKFASKIHLRICLEGGYHVLDEATHYSSDLRPTARPLWKSSIGLLELGIISATGLSPMRTIDGRGTTDAFCVAKYGQKWDSRIGKVRIRLSTLESDRVYTHSYPLIVLQTSGVKKMGEIQLAVRFSCTSFFNMLYKYSQPLLPKMHYVHPLSIIQIDMLRYHANQIVSARLGRAEPPLKKEVVEYLLDVGINIWSWKNPITTILVHFLFIILVLYPELILPTIFLYLFVIGIWYYRWKPRHPPHMDIKLSHAHAIGPDDLDEEFDPFPTQGK
ncbi:unnamed protein product [Thlaspi arvense]|uniref:C2 domain-containing protein n=1 Tax=Thlaspi arvense TaxID=13288 RepID=A0AAU9SKH5_THLAR|nr:unnamed protein product [Thlaspi arvense]